MKPRSSLSLSLSSADNDTSSLGSADGLGRSESPACPTIAISGLDPARVSRSAPQVTAEVAGSIHPNISGRLGSDSSPSTALLSCLASRLPREMEVLGLPTWQPTSKILGTRSPRLICVLRCSDSHPVSEFSSLPTPTAKANALAPSMSKWPAYARLVTFLRRVAWSYTSWTRRAMGYPVAWASAAATVMQSTSTSRRSSSVLVSQRSRR